MRLPVNKISKVFLMLFALFLSVSHAAVAQNYTHTTMTESYVTTAGEKLVSGLANVVTGFVELPKNIIITIRQEGVPYGVTIGFVTGIMHTVGRTGVGALDIATFLIPTKPSVQPPYIWKDFSRETTYGN
ncbi:exosortase system-associated protein, TIGR04073 family [Nitrosomonas cryotolerans]|nr:exosortase system-associated protein, TIGR04073 family [Nitrosomonas cryotolerans]